MACGLWLVVFAFFDILKYTVLIVDRTLRKGLLQMLIYGLDQSG